MKKSVETDNQSKNLRNTVLPPINNYAKSKTENGPDAKSNSRNHEIKNSSRKMAEQERWVLQRVDTLKNGLISSPLPNKIRSKLAVDPNEINSKGETLLIAAVRYILDPQKQLKSMNLLLRAGADVNARDKQHQRTALIIACMLKRRVAVKALVCLGETQLNIADKEGTTALMAGVLGGDVICCQLLLHRILLLSGTAPLAARNANGRTAADLAEETDNELLQKLLSRESVILTMQVQHGMSSMGQKPKVARRIWLKYKATHGFQRKQQGQEK